MAPSIFENLSDEIILIIVEYSGDIQSALRTYCGLNTRLTNILFDRRSRLLAHLLYITIDDDDEDFNRIYNSSIFQDLLLSIKTTENADKIIEYLQSFLVVHLKDKYLRLGNEYQSKMAAFLSQRTRYTSEKLDDFCCQLKNELDKLKHSPNLDILSIDKVYSLILTHGADMRSNDTFASRKSMFVTDTLFAFCRQSISNQSQVFHKHLIHMLKALVIPNGYHLKYAYQNRYIRSESHPAFNDLIRQLTYMKSSLSSESRSINMYRILLEIVLFYIQCLKCTFHNDYWSEFDLLGLMKEICSTELITNDNIFVETVQKEILKFILNEYTEKNSQLIPSTFLIEKYFELIRDLIIKNRINEIIFFYRFNQKMKDFFDTPNHIQKLLRLMLANRSGRQLFHRCIDEHLLESWAMNEQWIFYLVDKRESGYLKKLFATYPSLLHVVDQNGNNLLLYICLKEKGRRYSMIKLLIEIGCNQQIENFHGQRLCDVAQLERNREIFNFLKTKEIIKIQD